MAYIQSNKFIKQNYVIKRQQKISKFTTWKDNVMYQLLPDITCTSSQTENGKARLIHTHEKEKIGTSWGTEGKALHKGSAS